jgi:hypothetical protein
MKIFNLKDECDYLKNYWVMISSALKRSQATSRAVE